MAATGLLTVTTPSDREVVLTCHFDAPRRMVFDALTTPELLRRWYGPRDWVLVVCDIDLRVGGAWHYVSRRPDGKSIGQFGVYREVIPGERLVFTEAWEDWDAGETLVTTVLVEHHGTTTLSSTLVFPSREVRDTVLTSGVDRGANETYERLAQLLAAALARMPATAS